MLESTISLERYRELETLLQKFSSSNKYGVTIFDKEDNIYNRKKALQNYLSHMYPKLTINIFDISDLPKGAKICLFVNKNEDT